MSTEQIIPTVCASHCGGSCVLKVHVRDGIITRIDTDDGEEPQFRACLKGRAYRQRVYSPDRLKYPMKRVGERGEGKFERITWDDALNIMTTKLRELRERGEAHKLTASFFPHSITDPKWRFLNAYGGFINTALPHWASAKIVSFIKTM